MWQRGPRCLVGAGNWSAQPQLRIWLGLKAQLGLRAPLMCPLYPTPRRHTL
jgi:hypothetical protein